MPTKASQQQATVLAQENKAARQAEGGQQQIHPPTKATVDPDVDPGSIERGRMTASEVKAANAEPLSDKLAKVASATKAHFERGTGPLRERIQRIREEIAYVQKSKLSEGAPYKTALAHEVLLAKVRPFFVRERILWYPVEVESLNCWRGIVPTKRGERHVTITQIRAVIRFECANEPSYLLNDDGPTRPEPMYDHLDIPVISDGFDDADKASPKAATYADKKAIMLLLNLEQGDDPDYDRRTEDLGVDEDVADAIAALDEVIARHPDYRGNPEAYKQGALVSLARAAGRYRTPTIYHLSVDQLRAWALRLTEEVAEIEAKKN